MPSRVPIKQRMMLLSVVAALTTMGLKFFAWKLTGSVGLFSDAAESVVNLVAALFGLYALCVAARPPDDDHEFGHHKVEYFAAALEGALILVASGTIGYAAILRFENPAPLSELGVGLLVSFAAAGVNALVAAAMMRVARREDSLVLEADAHHLLTDVWTSLGILGGLGVVLLIPSATWLDPLIAVFVSLNIARVGFTLVRRAVDGLMDRALPHGEKEKIDGALRAVLPPHSAMANLRTHKAGSVRFVYFDLLLPGDMTVEASHAICDELEEAISEALEPCEVTIHVEPLPA